MPIPAPGSVRPSADPTRTMPCLGRGAPRPTAGTVRVVGTHFIVAIGYLVIGAIGLVAITPQLAAGIYLAPTVSGLTHVFTLGWLTMTILGALYQFLPGVLSTPIRFVRAGYVSVCLLAPGIACFAAGVAWQIPSLHHLGIALVAVGSSLTLINVLDALRRARRRDVAWFALALSLVFLVSTFALGTVLLHSLHTGFLGVARLRVLAVHLHVALVGWALVLSIGFSHRLLPMFLAARGADTTWTARALVLIGLGLPVLGFGVIAEITWLAWTGVALLEGGMGCFFWQSRAFYRVRKKIDAGMRFVVAGLGCLGVCALLGPVVLWRGAEFPRLATMYLIIGLLGGIVLYVIGFSYRIVPAVAWTLRYGGRTSGPVPLLTETFSVRMAHVQLGFMTLAVAVLAVGVGAASPVITYSGALLLGGGILLFAKQTWQMAFGEAKISPHRSTQ